MHFGKINKCDIANGEGIRVSLFVSGCRNQCKECFNKETWDFRYGQEFNDNVIKQIIEYASPSYINGLTILGGEPFEEENQKELLPLIKTFKKAYPNKTIWAYTGYLFDQDLVAAKGKKHTEYTMDILKEIDVIVDGRFINELKSLSLKFRGSTNQRIIMVSESLKNNKVILSPLNEYKEFNVNKANHN